MKRAGPRWTAEGGRFVEWMVPEGGGLTHLFSYLPDADPPVKSACGGHDPDLTYLPIGSVSEATRAKAVECEPCSTTLENFIREGKEKRRRREDRDGEA